MPTVLFDNRAVIVTGAGGGLGRTYALEIARRGGMVLVNDLGCTPGGRGASRNMADAVVAEIKDAGGRAAASYDDIGSPDGAGRAVATALEHFGRIDALINNAGIMRAAWLADFKMEDWDAQIRTHLTGTFLMTQAVWPHMKAQGFGRIVFVSSSGGMFGNQTQIGYGAAKAGIIGFMNAVTQEATAHGILCNGLMPCNETRMGEERVPDAMPETVPYVQAVLPAMKNEFTTPMAVYLASEACASTHYIYSSVGARYARVFVGVTQGWQGPRDTPATADDIAAHIDAITDTKRGIHIPASLTDEFRIVATNPAPEI